MKITQHVGRSQHISAKGKVVDMNALRHANGAKRAIGNANQNARGDILNPDRSIRITRQQPTPNYYQNNPKGVNTLSVKEIKFEAG